jgi:hypothetical protein
MLLKLYPNKDWDWGAISSNPNITIDIIEENLDKRWNWRYMSANSSLPWAFVEKNLDLYWDWKLLSKNSCVTWEIIKENFYLDWDWGCLSENPNITHEIITANAQLAWDMSKFAYNNPNSPSCQIPQAHPIYEYSYNMSKNPDFFEHFLPSEYWKWDLKGLSENPKVTWDFIFAHIDISWSWAYLSQRHDITWNIIERKMDIDLKKDTDTNMYSYRNIGRHLNVDWNPEWNMTEKLTDTNTYWDWTLLSENPAITWEIVEKHRKFANGKSVPWDLAGLSANPSITWDVIKDNPNPLGRKWNPRALSVNPNITWHIIKTNPKIPSGGEWNWYSLGKNKFQFGLNA